MDKDGTPSFLGTNVCRVLGIASTGNAYRRLEADELSYIRRVAVGLMPGRDLALITESGLYKRVMRSDKKVAKDFQNWVTRTVLPAIRKDANVRVR